MLLKKAPSYYSSALNQISKSSAVVPLKAPSQRNNNNTMQEQQQQQQHNDNNETQRQAKHMGEHINPGVAIGHARESVGITSHGRAYHSRCRLQARTRVGESNHTQAIIPMPVNLTGTHESRQK